VRVIDRERTGGKLHVSDGCKIDESVEVDTSGDIFIGEGTCISDDALILTHDHSPEDITAVTIVPKIIGSNVWIGARAVVLASCHIIGNGAVIGAGSVVTKPVEAYTLVAGNPAREIRKLAR
jgi:acetyltransferase-like isoleucine patch superfamily enzyme